VHVAGVLGERVEPLGGQSVEVLDEVDERRTFTVVHRTSTNDLVTDRGDELRI
jgi:hypothetical protein